MADTDNWMLLSQRQNAARTLVQWKLYHSLFQQAERIPAPGSSQHVSSYQKLTMKTKLSYFLFTFLSCCQGIKLVWCLVTTHIRYGQIEIISYFVSVAHPNNGLVGQNLFILVQWFGFVCLYHIAATLHVVIILIEYDTIPMWEVCSTQQVGQRMLQISGCVYVGISFTSCTTNMSISYWFFLLALFQHYSTT